MRNTDEAMAMLKKQKIPWYLIVVFLVVSAGLVTAGYFFYQLQKDHIVENVQANIASVAGFKVQQIVDWRKERLANVRFVQNHIPIARLARRFLKDPLSAELRKSVQTQMKLIQENYSFKSVALLDREKRIRLSWGQDIRQIGSEETAFADAAIKKKSIVFQDLHRDPTTRAISMDYFVPLLIPQGRGKEVVAVFLFRIDPQEFLYPLIQTWLTPSRTAETLLIRREGDEVVFLNELRHQRDTALKLRLPVSDRQLPAAMAAVGREGIVEGLDYRGVPVLAAIKAVPGSPWHLIAKIDSDEAYAPLREHLWISTAITTALILLCAAVLGFIRRHDQAHEYRMQYEAELEKKKLTRHYEYLTKFANDIILMINEELRIAEVNERAIEAYGYSRDELLRMSIRELRDPETLPYLNDQVVQWNRNKGAVYETSHRRKDGTVFPVEASVRPMEIEGKKFYQGIVRDVTERRHAEENLRKSLLGAVQAIASIVELKDPYTAGHQRRVSTLSRAIAQEMGLAPEQCEGIRIAGMIHDIGKVSVPTEFLSKPGKISAIEFSLIKEHVQSGYDILKDIEFPWSVDRMILQHHERMDGSGYPQGLSGKDILLEARIIAVADVVEAMATHRPYRPSLGVDHALEEITENRGVLYDPETVDACLRLFREKGFTFEA